MLELLSNIKLKNHKSNFYDSFLKYETYIVDYNAVNMHMHDCAPLKTLWHVDSQNRDSNRRPFGHETTGSNFWATTAPNSIELTYDSYP